MSPKPPIAAAVVTHAGRVLLVRRRVAEGSLSWQLPAGQIEPGESPAAAAVRETAEETGVVVLVEELLGERIHPATGRAMSYFACQVVSGQARVADPGELDAVEWVSLERLAELVPDGLYGPVQDYLDVVMTC